MLAQESTMGSKGMLSWDFGVHIGQFVLLGNVESWTHKTRHGDRELVTSLIEISRERMWSWAAEVRLWQSWRSRLNEVGAQLDITVERGWNRSRHVDTGSREEWIQVSQQWVCKFRKPRCYHGMVINQFARWKGRAFKPEVGQLCLAQD